MTWKRTIPMVAAAVLALGAAGCGGDNGGGGGVEQEAQDFCESFVNCSGGGSVDGCTTNYLPSYITDACRNALLDFFQCADENLVCDDPTWLEACQDEADAVNQACEVTDGG